MKGKPEKENISYRD